MTAALGAKHRRQLLHGDLKPDNVVLDGPQPVVIDWSLARLQDKAEQNQATVLTRYTRLISAPQLLHGDLKPDNVVLDGPQPVVVDWGLARLLDKAEQDQSTGLPRGTRFFGAPELFTTSEPFAASEAPYADIWSLGATIYYMFAGEPPLAREADRIYPGETLGSAQIARLARQGRITIIALDELVPDTPPELAQLVQQMLAIVPADRAIGSDPWAAAAA